MGNILYTPNTRHGCSFRQIPLGKTTIRAYMSPFVCFFLKVVTWILLEEWQRKVWACKDWIPDGNPHFPLISEGVSSVIFVADFKMIVVFLVPLICGNEQLRFGTNSAHLALVCCLERNNGFDYMLMLILYPGMSGKGGWLFAELFTINVCHTAAG